MLAMALRHRANDAIRVKLSDAGRRIDAAQEFVMNEIVRSRRKAFHPLKLTGAVLGAMVLSRVAQYRGQPSGACRGLSILFETAEPGAERIAQGGGWPVPES